MNHLTVSKNQFGKLLADMENLISDVEVLVEDQDHVAKKRLGEMKTGTVHPSSEKELDSYLAQKIV